LGAEAFGAAVAGEGVVENPAQGNSGGVDGQEQDEEPVGEHVDVADDAGVSEFVRERTVGESMRERGEGDVGEAEVVVFACVGGMEIDRAAPARGEAEPVLAMNEYAAFDGPDAPMGFAGEDVQLVQTPITANPEEGGCDAEDEREDGCEGAKDAEGALHGGIVTG